MYNGYQRGKEIYAGLTNAYNSGTPYSYLNNHSTTAVNPNYVPPASVKQDGTWEGYKIQKVSLEPGDVLLCHISANMKLSDCQNILKELQEAFPNNTVMLCNEQVLKGMTVLKGAKEISPIVDIAEEVNIEKIIDDILKGHPNDFLH
jgi:hypothetical protein